MRGAAAGVGVGGAASAALGDQRRDVIRLRGADPCSAARERTARGPRATPRAHPHRYVRHR